MQSGITASRELHDAFNALLTSPAQRGLVVGIRNERLIPTFIIPSTSPDFLEDFSVLDSILDENEAAYILLRKYDAAPDGYVAITYVPDTAPVRSKMLFASTRLTLMRELGTERFRDSLFATTKVEMGREGWERHERHERVEAPLTEEESALAGIKRAEAEVGRGTTDRSSHVSSGLNFVISEDALEALKGLGTDDGHNLIQLRIDVQKECIELAGTNSVDTDGLKTAISPAEPRYSFYRHSHTHGDQRTSPIVFIYTCPPESKIKERMLYASSRAGILSTASQEAGLEVAKKLEASSPADISESVIDEELHPSSQQRQTFSRPKRPGKR